MAEASPLLNRLLLCFLRSDYGYNLNRMASAVYFDAQRAMQGRIGIDEREK